MPIPPETTKEILKFIQQKIETDEMWAEAFTKLITLDEPDQNGAVWDLLESIKDSIRWDESFARNPEKQQAMADAALKSYKERKTIPMDEFLALAADGNILVPVAL